MVSVNNNMKIFIEKYNVSKIEKKLHLLNTFVKNITIHTEIYSEHGMYFVNKTDIYKLNIESDKSYKFSHNGYDFIIDESIVSKENVFQIPADHESIELITWSYNLNHVNLVVEFRSIGVVPQNIYFEVPDDIQIYSVLNDLDVFLSLIN